MNQIIKGIKLFSAVVSLTPMPYKLALLFPPVGLVVLGLCWEAIDDINWVAPAPR